jgi:hypothetical protein
LAPADANDRGETGLMETQILLLLIRLHERIELLACAKLFAIHDKSRPPEINSVSMHVDLAAFISKGCLQMSELELTIPCAHAAVS